MTYQSWGKLFNYDQEIILPSWQNDCDKIFRSKYRLLPYGLGRSYGDSCLNANEALVITGQLNRLLYFDKENGLIKVEAGISLRELLNVIIPHGWFLAVTPGTKDITVGGAIANDVHGKNHHKSGTFSSCIDEFCLLRSDEDKYICSRKKNQKYFSATIGGLGLTGIILWAQLRLKKIESSLIEQEVIRFETIDEFIHLSEVSDNDFEYSVSWIDCFSRGRGHLIRGNHMRGENGYSIGKEGLFSVPCNMPNFLLNRCTMKMFNFTYYHKQFRKKVTSLVHYDQFFYPLDVISNWNRIYGTRGFFQYQCVISFGDSVRLIQTILENISRSGLGSFLAVLKKFGDVRSDGMLSFPRAGYTLAFDIPNRGESSLRLLNRLDKIVMEAGGAIYPAKDARMNKKMFQCSFSRLEEFYKYKDVKFSSSFWNRVTL